MCMYPPCMHRVRVTGFCGSILGSLCLHPNGKNYITCAGGCLVVNDLADPHNQVFLRGHNDNISCLALSPSGRLIASGQVGENCDVIVWDFERKELVWRLQEHFHGISCLAFSDDEVWPKLPMTR
jgi:WD40 repeat protein